MSSTVNRVRMSSGVPKIFISHSSYDKPFVRELVTKLNDFGIIAWVDETQIKVGESIPNKINNGLRNCNYFLIVLSKNAVESKWVEREIDSSYFNSLSGGTSTILPIILEDLEIPPLLRPLKYADFRTTMDDGIGELMKVFDINEHEIKFYTRKQKIEEIERLLLMVNAHGELPYNIIDFVEDESFIPIFEKNINISANRRILINSIDSLRHLAEGHIRLHSSIDLLKSLYQDSKRANDRVLMLKSVEALIEFDSVVSTDFLMQLIESTEIQPPVISAILSNWQYYNRHRWGMLEELYPNIIMRLNKILIIPQSNCLFYDYDGEESDCRFFVLRCLTAAKRQSSLTYIDEFMTKVKFPIVVRVLGAIAYWRISEDNKKKYITVLDVISKIEPKSNEYNLAQSLASEFLGEELK